MKKFFRIAAIFAALTAAVGFVAFLFVKRSAERALEEQRRSRDDAGYPAETREIGPLNRVAREGWRIIATGRRVRDMVFYESRVWAATSGGLLSVAEDGGDKKLYTRLNGLPDADVTCLAVHDGKLFAGTTSGALIIIKNGRIAVAASPEQPLGRLTALLSTPEGLLIGTGESGAWLFDGRAVRDISQGRSGADFKKIARLAMRGDKLAVGSFDDGVYIEEPAGFAHFTGEQGLPDNHVSALEVSGGVVLVGAPLGWARIDENNEVAVGPDSSFITAFIGPEDLKGIDEFEAYGLLVGSQSGLSALEKNGSIKILLDAFSVNSLMEAKDRVYVGTDDGIFRSAGAGFEPFYSPSLDEISGNHITAVLPRGNELWIGSFESGLTILDGDFKVKSKPEGGAWAINGLLEDVDAVWVAHNHGVSMYKGTRLLKKITSRDGLMGKHVSAVCSVPGGRAYATEGGITLDTGGLLSGLYAFHGLANNHAYACAAMGDKIYVGTLGGLSVIKNRKVIKSYRPGESPLKTGWIAALASSGKSLFIGTYGGGVQRLDSGEKWADYGESTGPFEVNPGAMLVDGNKLLAGSLDRGLFIIDISTGRWSNITEGLPSNNITSLAADSRYYYVGADMGLAVIPRESLE